MSWKSPLVAIACALVLSSDVAAQLPSMTILVGPTRAARETNAPAFVTEPLWTIGGGGGFRFGTGTFAIQPEVLIVSKGTSSVDGDTETQLRLDYIEFPVIGMITLATGRKLRPFIGAGPVLELEMRCRVHFLQDNSKEEVGCDLSNAATFDRRKIDVAVAGLAGVDYALGGSRRLSLQARYTRGFTNISDAEDRTLEIRNRAFSMYVGLTFPLQPDF